eukprot:GEMP01021847.1.p1 GENE.GEMP01021847.1~~GEMP01021847.1.p1  ORF type:complete len:522 (+),score=98.80 GEMP01021847.1:49-1614(+)
MNDKKGADELSLEKTAASQERPTVDSNQNRKMKPQGGQGGDRDVSQASNKKLKTEKSLSVKKTESSSKSTRATKSPKASGSPSHLTARSSSTMATGMISPPAAKSSGSALSTSIDSKAVVPSAQSASRNGERMLHGRKIPSTILLCRVQDLVKLLEKVDHAFLTQTIFKWWFLETARELRRKPFAPSFSSTVSGLIGLSSILEEPDPRIVELPLAARGRRPSFQSTVGFLFDGLREEDSEENTRRDRVMVERRRDWEKSGRRPALSVAEDNLFGAFFAFATDLLNSLTFSEFAIGSHAVAEESSKALRYAFKRRDFDDKMRLTPQAFRKKQEKAGCFALTADPLYTIDVSTWYFQLEITDSEGREGPSEDGIAIGFSAHGTAPLGATAADEIPDVIMCGYEGAFFNGLCWSPIFWRPRELCPGDCVGIMLKPPSKRGKQCTFTLYVNETIEVETKVTFPIPSSGKVYGLIELLGNTHAVKIHTGVPVMMSTDGQDNDESSIDSSLQAHPERGRYSFSLPVE